MSASFSACGQYRYALSRPGPAPVVVIMLNPSTAGAGKDDPTIRRLLTFFPQGFVVLNLYALRSTDPAGLWVHPDPVGPDNDTYLQLMCAGATEVVCAWGAAGPPDRVAAVVAMLRGAGVRLRCLGITKGGAPRHPLYVHSSQPVVDWL